MGTRPAAAAAARGAATGGLPPPANARHFCAKAWLEAARHCPPPPARQLCERSQPGSPRTGSAALAQPGPATQAPQQCFSPRLLPLQWELKGYSTALDKLQSETFEAGGYQW